MLELRSVDVATFSASEQIRLPVRLWREGIEVYHAPYYVKPYLVPRASVVTIHDVISDLHPQYLPSRLARVAFHATTRLALASADRVIVPSENSKLDLVRVFGVKPEKVAVTHYAADPRFGPRDRRGLEEVRQRYGLPERYVLYTGINKPHKNLVRLVEAFGALPRALSARLVIAGKEDVRYPQARLAAEGSPARDRIVFLSGATEEDWPYLYNLAEAFIFPSLYEGFGLPPLEAMASGLPVICSNASSLPEVVGDAALLFEPHDVAALAQAMQRLLEDAELREMLIARGLERAKAFSWRETARQTLAVYQEAAGP